MKSESTSETRRATLLWDKFLEMRLALLPSYLTLSEKEVFSEDRRLTSSTLNFGKNYSPKSELEKVKHLYSRMDSQLFHLERCNWGVQKPDPSGWEYRFLGNWQKVFADYAEYIYSQSPTLREALDQWQGLWKFRISGQFSWSDDRRGLRDRSIYPHLSADKFDTYLRTGLIFFEALRPGLVESLLKELRSKRVSLIQQRHYQGVTYDAANPVTDFEYLKQVQLTLSVAINELRPDCKHYELISCLVCNQYLGPRLFENASLFLPNEVCAWCLKLLIPDGLSKKDLNRVSLPDKQLQIEAFRLAAENFDFTYWRSPVLTEDLIRSLNLKSASSSMLKFAASILSCLPRDLKDFGSERHFFAETGLEELLPPDRGRGKKSISRCGHLCLSMGEREICEYLYQREIAHSREPEYSALVPVQNSYKFGLMRGDFLVGDVVIEFAGLTGDASYDAKIKTKVELCEMSGIKLIVVKPSHLKNLDIHLSHLAPE